MKLNVFSETSALKNVIIHSPIGEHNYISKINTQEYIDNKINPDFLLFDETVDSKLLKSEHHNLKLILDNFTKSNTITFQRLLIDILVNKDVCIELINKVIESEIKLYGKINQDLKNNFFLNLNPYQISVILITGYLNDNQLFKFPLPNLIFTRDIGVVIGNTLVTTWSWHKSRQRESIITKFIISYQALNRVYSQKNILIPSKNRFG